VENRRKQEENQEEKRGKKRKPAAHNWELNAADKLGVPTMRKMWERCCCEWFSRTQPSLYVCMYAAYAYLSAFSLSVSAFRSNCIPLSLPVWRRRWRIRNVIVWAQQKIKHTQRVSLVVAVDDVKFSALGRYTSKVMPQKCVLAS